MPALSRKASKRVLAAGCQMFLGPMNALHGFSNFGLELLCLSFELLDGQLLDILGITSFRHLPLGWRFYWAASYACPESGTDQNQPQEKIILELGTARRPP